MKESETIIYWIAILALIYVIAKIGLAVLSFLGFLSQVSDYLNSIPYLNTIFLIILAAIVGYYVFIK
jgi:hypothetical protein